MKTAYDAGYETGLGWQEDYTPGGPRVMYPREDDSDIFKERCRKSLENKKEWHLGFNQGKEDKANENG